MDSFYQGEAMDVGEHYENWNAERELLTQQIKDLQNALDKSKKLHRKFAEDVIESEEIRNRDFDRIKRELVNVNKQHVAEIRELSKDKCFYENTCAALIKEKEMSSNFENARLSTKAIESSTNVSITDKSTRSSCSNFKSKFCRSGSNFKISTKLFEDNKKLKEKVSKLTKSNANLRKNVKQLENFKSKINTKKQQQVADEQTLQDLVKTTTRTNSQIFNNFVLSQLDQFYQTQPNI